MVEYFMKMDCDYIVLLCVMNVSIGNYKGTMYSYSTQSIYAVTGDVSSVFVF
jgi:hypothetical protein